MTLAPKLMVVTPLKVLAPDRVVVPPNPSMVRLELFPAKIALTLIFP